MAVAWWSMGMGGHNDSALEYNYRDDSSAYANRHNLFVSFLGISTGRAVRFKAFLDSFEDAYASNWNEEDVYGRMDPIATFQSTKRTLSFGFDVPSACYAEAVANFRKLELLIALLYPGYSGGGANAISSAPLFKVSFSNWINNGTGGSVKESGLVGAIKGFNFSPDLESGVWDDPQFVTPKLFKVSVDMTVLHTHSLGWNGSSWRGPGPGSSFPYGAPFADQPDGMELPDRSVTQTGDNGASGTDEMVNAAELEMLNATEDQSLDGGMSMDPTQAGAPMSSAEETADFTTNTLD